MTLAKLMAGTAALTLCAGTALAETTIRVAYENNPGEPADLVMNRWAELVEEASGGEVPYLCPLTHLLDIYRLTNMRRARGGQLSLRCSSCSEGVRARAKLCLIPKSIQ